MGLELGREYHVKVSTKCLPDSWFDHTYTRDVVEAHWLFNPIASYDGCEEDAVTGLISHRFLIACPLDRLNFGKNLDDPGAFGILTNIARLEHSDREGKVVMRIYDGRFTWTHAPDPNVSVSLATH